MKIRECPLSLMRQNIAGTFDLFICSGSFEDRCLSIAQSIYKTPISYKLVIFNEDNQQYVGENTDKLSSLLGENTETVKISMHNPLLTADNIGLAFETINSQMSIQTILLDITTFTHEALLIILCLIRIHFRDAKLTCGYTNASEYSTDEEGENKWLSKGICDVRSVLGYAGNLSPSQKTHLIVIVGYESERALKVIEAIEPSSISLGYGRPNNATTDKDRDANQKYKDIVSSVSTQYQGGFKSEFEILCDDPFQSAQAIEKEIQSHPNHNIIIVPMNNKISTIGVALIAFVHKEVQIAYAPALTYNYYHYSKPGKRCYLFDLEMN